MLTAHESGQKHHENHSDSLLVRRPVVVEATRKTNATRDRRAASPGVELGATGLRCGVTALHNDDLVAE